MKKDKRFKILILIPNLGRGGAQQVFRDQLQFYSENYNTIGCVFNWDDTFQDDHQTNILSLDIPAGKTWSGKIICFWRRVIALKKIKKEHDIDFSISHLEGADYVNLLSKRKEKVICWIHGTKKFDQNIEGILGLLRKRILIPLTYKISDLIITVSEGIRQELIKEFGVPATKIRTIYNGFDLKEISSKALQNIDSSFNELFAKTVLITHCRLSRQKNVFALLDIFRLTKNQQQVKLMILGDGELRDELLEHCKTLNLSVYSIWNTAITFNLDYDIYFLGYERNPYPYLHRASLYLMTSSWEGFPLSLCEAMACEIPVVTTDCYTGPREIITPELNHPQPVTEPTTSEYGVLMPLANTEKNIEIWVNTVKSLLANTELRKSLIIKGKERVQIFDKKSISSQWLEILT
jgi:glycosyltransferase involved in cell wall biosynthesis